MMDTLAPKRERFQSILSLIADYAKETKNYAQEISKAGDVVRHALEAQIADVEKRYAALTKERNELESLLDARRLTEEAVKAALQFREDAVTGMQDPIFENKRKILELLDTQVTVKDRQIKTTCLIPVCANEVDDVRRLRQGSRKVSARRSDDEDAWIGAQCVAQNARTYKNSRAHFSF